MSKRDPLPTTLSIRPATPQDATDVRRLAALDSAFVPAGALLIGLIDGHASAALSLTTGAVVADPFRPTAAVVELLRVRARALHGSARAPGALAGRRLAFSLRRGHGRIASSG